MGKKNFFKLPSKKTMEHILIGILFVAVLSCTMKMINNIEGFGCGDPVAGECELISENTGNTAIGGFQLVGDGPMVDSVLTALGTLALTDGGATVNLSGQWGFLTIDFGDGEAVMEVNLDNRSGAGTLTADDIIAKINEVISSKAVAYKNSDIFTIVTLPTAAATQIVLGYKAQDGTLTPIDITGDADALLKTAVQNLAFGGVFASLGITTVATAGVITLIAGASDATSLTCAEWRAKLIEAAAAAAAASGTVLTELSECIPDCETTGPGTCPQTGVKTGCALNDDNDDCVCVGENSVAGLGSFVDNGDFDFTGDNCLRSTIQEIYGVNDSGALGTRPGGWTNDGTGDICSPRFPCLDDQQAYLDIIGKTSTPGVNECNPDNLYDDTNNPEMRLNFCQPFGLNATFENCNAYDTKTACEGEGSSDDDDQCSWNPYCLSQDGLDKIKGGAETNGDRITCQGIHDHQTCDASNDCHWNWMLAEELNGFRGKDNLIPNEIPKISELTDPGIFTTDLTNCTSQGSGPVDNTKCSFYAGLQTMISDDNRPPGFCNKKECVYKKDNSNCMYCSTFALEDNTPGLVPDTVSNWLEWSREQSGTSNSQPQQATAEKCYQMFPQ